MNVFYKVEISAENQQQANKILNSLLAKRLATGGQMITSPARFLWKGKVQDMEYVTISSFTLAEHKEAIMADVRNTSIEEVPMVTFQRIIGNPELEKWITESL